MTCTVVGCSAPPSCRGWCTQHYNLWYHMGVHPRLYEALLAIQEEKCAVCGRPETGKRLALDHDHTTGAFRGLLCSTCNRYLVGSNTVETIKRVAAYLNDPPMNQIPEELFTERMRLLP